SCPACYIPEQMARLDRSLAENVPGEFFVDDTCIDCETCQQIAPDVFADVRGEHSIVARQPANEVERTRAAMALVACPRSRMGARDRGGSREAVVRFPDPIADDVMYLGFASESSFGARSYFVRSGNGNVAVDSPRAARPLVDKLAALGGVA